MCLNNSFQFFWKYMWVKTYMKIRAMLFNNWKHVFKYIYQTGLEFPTFLSPSHQLCICGLTNFIGPFEYSWKLKTEKYYNKIIFKCMNSIVGPIFNEKDSKKKKILKCKTQNVGSTKWSSTHKQTPNLSLNPLVAGSKNPGFNKIF